MLYEYMCVWKYFYMPALLSELYTCRLSAGRDRKWSKTQVIALPLSGAQTQPAKHCSREIRWLKFIQTLTLQT